MKFNNLFFLTLITGSLALFFACGDDNSRPLKDEFSKAPSGIYYYFHSRTNDSIFKPETGDYVKALIDWGLRDSMIVNSKMSGGPAEFQIQPTTNPRSVFSAIKMMSVGDSATFIITAGDYFFPAKTPDFLNGKDELYFDIRLLEKQSQAAYLKQKKRELEDMKSQEKVKLEQYIEENNIETKPLGSGLYFIPLQEGKGDLVEKGKMLKINYEYSLIDGKKLYSTWDMKKPMEFRYGSKFDTRGMNQALSMMKEGGRAKLIVPSHIGYGERGRAQFIPPYSTLVYEVEVLEVISEEEYRKDNVSQARDKQKTRIAAMQKRREKEPELIDEYLKSNKLDVKPNSNGLYFLEREKGAGISPEMGDSVTVHYKQFLLDGKKLVDSRESNIPFKFVAGRGQVLLGWEIAIRNMKEGGKARILLPSNLAYHDRGAGKFIEPYTPLIYEIELIDVTPRTFKNSRN